MAAPTSDKTVLLVDDDDSSRLLISTRLTVLGYHVLQANSAHEGRKVLDEKGSGAFDLIISDYWMPGENGLEFLKHVHLQAPCLSLILITADGEKEVLENLVKLDSCGFLQKPFSQADLAKKVARAVERTGEQRRFRSTETEANKLGENQRLLLKQHLEVTWPGVEFSFSSKSQASGDFVSSIDMTDGSKILLLSDASGHELSSALQSNYFHGLARGMLVKESSVEEVFNFFNETLITEWSDEGMVGNSLAACAIRFSPATQSITFINAGFPRPMIGEQDGFAQPLGSEQGAPPLGWFSDPYPTEKRALPKGGTLTAWTDGLEDLAEALQVDPLALADRLVDAQRNNTSLIAQSHDDIAVVRVKIPGIADQTDSLVPIVYQEYPGTSIDHIDTIQTFCEQSIRYALPAIDAGRLSEVLVCLREALINALRHGCQGTADLTTTLQIARSHDRSKLSVQIQDQGEGHSFDWETHAEDASTHLIAEHRGLIMMQTIPSRTEVLHRGATVRMEFDGANSLN